MRNSKPPKTVANTLGGYVLRATAEAHVARTGEPDDFVDEFQGDVLAWQGEQRRVRAGRFRVLIVRLGDAFEAGMPFLHVFDDHSDELLEYWKPLFNPNESDFKEAISREFDIFHINLMVLDHVEILPAHRGRFLALAVASKLIEMFAGGCGLVVCKPFPLQLSRAGNPEKAWSTRMKLADFDQQSTRATARLRDYWGKLGFARVGRSPIYALSLSISRPRIEEICGLELY